MKQETLEQDAELEKLAMDKLKSKWEHLYTFGYPQKPFPTKYENDLNNVKVGLYDGAKWQQERSYSEEEVNSLFDTLKSNSIDNVVTITNVDLFISSWKQQFKNK